MAKTKSKKTEKTEGLLVGIGIFIFSAIIILTPLITYYLTYMGD